MTKVPWTAKEVKNLQSYQADPDFTSYMCKVCPPDSWHTSTVLEPTDNGWLCPKCGKIVQTWAYASDTSGEFKNGTWWR